MSRAGMANLLTRLRTLTNDGWHLKQDTATGDGSTKTFWLTENPQAAGGTVSVGGTVSGTTAYTWDVTHGRVGFTSAPGAGLTVAVEYLHAGLTDDQMQEILDANVTHVEGQALRWLPDTIAGSYEYHRAALGYRDLEEAESGTIYWRVTESSGVDAGTADYTKDYITGQIRFPVNQSGSTYYWTGRSYDLYSAAADIWQRRQAEYSDWYQFSSEGQAFSRQQAFEHAVGMEKLCRQRAGQNKQHGEVRSNVFQRTDLNRRE